jgi:hypothetical protein
VPSEHDPTTGQPDLIGRWRKQPGDPCADRYPEEISFSEARYLGTRGADQGMIWWDVGIYRLDDPTTLTISTATDEMVTCAIELRGDRVTITDPDGCRFVYERIEEPPS